MAIGLATAINPRFDARMGRGQRAHGGSLIQHVTTRGNDRRAIFLDVADHHAFLRALADVTGSRRWDVLAYCLMPNHVHLLLHTRPDGLSSGMRDLLGPYARRFHRRHGTSGHLFGSRFHTVPIQVDRQMGAVVRYIALNPVAAGMCDRPEAWPWSSYAASIGAAGTPAFLNLTMLWTLVGRNPERAQDHIRALVQWT